MWCGHVALLGFSSEIGLLDFQSAVASSRVGSDDGNLNMLLPIVIPQHPPDGDDAAEGVENPFGPTPDECPGCGPAPMLQDDGKMVSPMDLGHSPWPDAADKFPLFEPQATYKAIGSASELCPSTHACI